MSSQFSYELDESHIRTLMQNAEVSHSNAQWEKFEAMNVASRQSSNLLGNYLPKINVSISRSIIVPILFITIIGGLSVILFNFVDFKKKEEIKKEIPFVAKVEPTKKPIVIAKKIIKLKEPVLIATNADSLSVSSAESVPTNSITIDTSAKIKKEEIIPAVVGVPEIKHKEEIITEAPVKKETAITPEKKKKKKRTQLVELPLIVNPANLNEGNKEPELELK